LALAMHSCPFVIVKLRKTNFNLVHDKLPLRLTSHHGDISTCGSSLSPSLFLISPEQSIEVAGKISLTNKTMIGHGVLKELIVSRVFRQPTNMKTRSD